MTVPTHESKIIQLPPMIAEQEATWEALFELAQRQPDHWCLIGGQMVALHAYEARRDPPRVTTDGDLVTNVRANQDALITVTGILLERGFTAQISSDDVGHRFVRGKAVLDVLLPDNIGTRRERPTASGARTIAAAGATQALDRASPVHVRMADGQRGRIARPSLLGALVAKCAAAEVDTRDRRRHLTDVVFLSSCITRLRAMRAETSKSDRRHLARASKKLEGDAAWLSLEDPTRAEAALRLLSSPLRG